LQVRQLAAVELRKRIASGDGRLWKKVDQNMRQQMKQSLLERLTNEQSYVSYHQGAELGWWMSHLCAENFASNSFKLTHRSLVRHALARAVSAIADIELGTTPPQWPDLVPTLYQAAASPNKTHRETAIYVLYSLLDTVADSFESELKQLFQLFTQTLGDPESGEVRITTLRALAKVAEYISVEDKHDIKAFQDLIVPMLQVLQQAVNDDDEQGVKYGNDVFETLLILDTPLVSKHVAELVQFFMGVAGNKEVDGEMRCGALNVLSWIIR
jgi:hypothetical protein